METTFSMKRRSHQGCLVIISLYNSILRDEAIEHIDMLNLVVEV